MEKDKINALVNFSNNLIEILNIEQNDIQITPVYNSKNKTHYSNELNTLYIDTTEEQGNNLFKISESLRIAYQFKVGKELDFVDSKAFALLVMREAFSSRYDEKEYQSREILEKVEDLFKLYKFNLIIALRDVDALFE